MMNNYKDYDTLIKVYECFFTNIAYSNLDFFVHFYKELQEKQPDVLCEKSIKYAKEVIKIQNKGGLLNYKNKFRLDCQKINKLKQIADIEIENIVINKKKYYKDIISHWTIFYKEILPLT